jgi:outer membrane protein, multidrug efflux system
MRHLNHIAIAIIVLSFAACKSGQNYQGAVIETPDSYRFAEAEPIDQPEATELRTDSLSRAGLESIDWFSLFKDPVLDTLVQQALNYNQDLRIAAESVTQAQDGLVVQRSFMLPQIGAQAGTTRGNFQQGLLLPEAQNVFFVGGFVNWEIDFWGKFRRLNEAARARIIESEEGYRATRISLTATVATLYFQLLEYHARLEISERNLALRDSMLTIIAHRFERGIVAEIDLNQAQIKRAIAAEAIPIWKRQIAKTENALSFLTGSNPRGISTGIALTNQDTAISIPAGLPSELLMRRPDVVAAEQALIAQNALIGVAKANRLPNISLTGLLGVASDELSTLTASPVAWNLGSSLLAPLFNFNRLQRQVDIAESQYEQALLAYERTVLDAFRSVEDVLIEISTLKEELEARQAHVTAALNAQRLSQARYDQGITSYLEFLESQRQAFESELNYVGTRQQLLTAYAQLYKVLGGGW